MSQRWIVFGLAACLVVGGCGKKDEGLVDPMTESADESPAGQTGEKERAQPDAGTGDAQNRVNLNTANAGTLNTVPGIGEKMADDIIAYREEHGKFKDVEELKGNIKGIGEKTFDKMKDYLTVEGGISQGSVEVAGAAAGSGKKSSKKKAPAGKVNINTATAEELAEVPGIGPKMADAIVAYRQDKGKFTSVEELKGNIKGIGEKTFEKMKDYLTVK